jgi:hypothetical protein
MAEDKIFSNSEIVQQLVQLLGKDSIDHISKYLEQKDKVATSNLINSLSYDFKQLVSNLSIELSSEDYLEYINRGRPSGYFPNVKKIKDWLTAKGLDYNEWAVATNIYKYGIKPTPFLDDYLSSSIINNATKGIEEIFGNRIETMLVELIDEMNKPK